MFIKLNNTNYNRKLIKCLFARGGKWYAELVNGEQFTISQSDFQTATDGMNAINGVYYFADVIAKVEVELKEEPSPEPPSGDLTPFSVGQTITGIEIDPTVDTVTVDGQSMSLSDWLINALSEEDSDKALIADTIILSNVSSDETFYSQVIQIVDKNDNDKAILFAANNIPSYGITGGKWYSLNLGEVVELAGVTTFNLTASYTIQDGDIYPAFAPLNGVVLGAVVADTSTKLLKSETSISDYTAHFKNGNTFPIDGTTFTQVTADFCQIGGAYYNPSIINRLYATKQPKYFVEFVNGQTLEITAQEYYDILGISGAKIEAGADLSVLFGNRAMDNAEVLAMLANLTYTDGKAVLATNSDGVELITAMNNSVNGYQIVLYNEFMPIWTEKGYKGMPAGWCGTDTVVDGKQFTFVEADGTVKLAEYLQLFDVGEVDLTVATVTEGEWNPLLVGAIQEE